jgi:hypothetical protein
MPCPDLSNMPRIWLATPDPTSEFLPSSALPCHWHCDDKIKNVTPIVLLESLDFVDLQIVGSIERGSTDWCVQDVGGAFQ